MSSMQLSFDETSSSSNRGLHRPKVPGSILRNASSKNTTLKDGSRVQPTQSTILPIRASTARSRTTSATSSSVTSYEYHDMNPLEYTRSNFPSLIQNLGLTSRSRSSRGRHKTFREHDDADSERSDTSESKYTYNFAEDLRKRNETRWLRIQAVAKDTMDRYDRYYDEINKKNKRQRSEIRQRNKDQLETLRLQEEKKHEIELYNSSHGRKWRHHRSMQRRALRIQEINSKHTVGYYPLPATVR